MFENITTLKEIRKLKMEYVKQQKFELAIRARDRETDIINKQKMRIKKIKRLYV